MQLTRNSLETSAGPDDWFTGTVYIDAVAAPWEPSHLAAASVHPVAEVVPAASAATAA